MRSDHELCITKDGCSDHSAWLVAIGDISLSPGTPVPTPSPSPVPVTVCFTPRYDSPALHHKIETKRPVGNCRGGCQVRPPPPRQCSYSGSRQVLISLMEIKWTSALSGIRVKTINRTVSMTDRASVPALRK